MVFALAGCGSTPTQDKKDSEAPPATITASPNPVPIPAKADKGPTVISWNTGDPTREGEVYACNLSNNKENLFAGLAPSGSKEAPWIPKAGAFEFRLYEGKEHKKVLAAVTVKAVEQK